MKILVMVDGNRKFKEWYEIDDMDMDSLRDEIIEDLEEIGLDYNEVESDVYVEETVDCPIDSQDLEDYEIVFEFLELEDYERPAVEYLLWEGGDLDDALEHREDVYMFEDVSGWEHDYMEQMAPEQAEALENSYGMLEINERWFDDNFVSFEDSEGTMFQVQRN